MIDDGVPRDPQSAGAMPRLTSSHRVLQRAYRLASIAADGGVRAAESWARWRGHEETSHALAERLARETALCELPRGSIWYHGASVGEVGAIAPLIRELSVLFPQLPRLLTTQTTTGRSRAAGELDVVARLAPLDSPAPMRRFLDATEPSLHVIIETELWPVRFEHLRRRRIPAAVVSARLSAERMPRYRRLRGLYQPCLASLAMVAPATADDGARFVSLGLPDDRLGPMGNLKWDAAPASPDERTSARCFEQLGIDRDLWWLILGSVHPGESSSLIEALGSAWREQTRVGVIVAPRHPSRFDQIHDELAGCGTLAHRASRGPAPSGTRWLLLDRLGVLKDLYPLAHAAVLGGSFVPVGGHSPLEAAAAGCPIIAGPHRHRQLDLLDPLAQRGAAVLVESASQAGAAISDWLANRDARMRAAAAARAAVTSQRGVAPRLARALGDLLS
ncbi:MAG: hypothetical protein JSV80_01290 [Acidobacteriota bacterium]|nr:MAG: hypothetical protein JSV80_01290 [Acidobacteriota bacterium]